MDFFAVVAFGYVDYFQVFVVDLGEVACDFDFDHGKDDHSTVYIIEGSFDDEF